MNDIVNNTPEKKQKTSSDKQTPLLPDELAQNAMDEGELESVAGGLITKETISGRRTSVVSTD